MKKAHTPLDPNVPYMFGLTPAHIKEIVMLATEKSIEWAEYDVRVLGLGVQRDRPGIWNNNSSKSYIVVTIPLRTKDGEYTDLGFSFRIYEDGELLFDNGGSVQMRTDNGLKIYKILLDHFQYAPEKTRKKKADKGTGSTLPSL